MRARSLPIDSYEKAQRVLLGHVLNFPSTADEIFARLRAGDADAFSQPVLRKIFEAMRALYGRGAEISVQGVVAETKRAGDSAGVTNTCLSCMDAADGEYKVQELGGTHDDYVRALREGYQLRNLKQTMEGAQDYKSAIRAVEEATAWNVRCGEGDGTDGEFRAVAERIYALRQKKGSGDRRKDYEIHTEVTSTILAHLDEKGRFYTDGHRAYLFFEAEKRLVEIDAEDDGFRLLLYRYGINPADPIYRWITAGLRNEAIARGERTEIHQLSYYDPVRLTLYVCNQANQIHRITPDRIDLVDNGTDGVLFVSDPRATSFERVSVPEGVSRFTDIISSKINFAADELTPGERQRVFELWFYSMYFESIMPTKPIVAFVGPKGSGKSITLRKVGMLLLGGHFDVTPLTTDYRDFDAAVTNSRFVAFDNADHKCAWLNDRLATAATGGVIKRRELYTTNRLVEIPTHCFVAITAHTPHFRRDDVADRLLIMKVERLKRFVSEKKLLSEVMAHRNEILSEVLLKLQAIVRALRAEYGVDDSSAFRMADFADFALKVARHEGREEQLKRIFGKLSHEQSEFTLEGDPIYETLSIWVPENEGREVTNKELWGELKAIAEREGIDFRRYEQNARGFARRMTNLQSNLQEFFEMADIPKRARVVYHSFRLKATLVNVVNEGE